MEHQMFYRKSVTQGSGYKASFQIDRNLLLYYVFGGASEIHLAT